VSKLMSADESIRSTSRLERPEDPSQPIAPDESLGELLGRVSRDFSELVSTQVELAKVELKEEIAAAGRGAGLLTGGAFCAYLAVVLLPKGKDRLSRVRPVPEKTAETVKEDVRWAREQMS
jgi:hypothetical protein